MIDSADFSRFPQPRHRAPGFPRQSPGLSVTDLTRIAIWSSLKLTDTMKFTLAFQEPLYRR